MPIDFPSSPSTNQIYSYNSKSWKWNGASWQNYTLQVSNIYAAQGRLTLTSGTPVLTTDVSSSTLYFTPYSGDLISLYDGSTWATYSFAERSLALSGLTSAKNYDVFIYNNSGTLTLELTAWSTDTARVTALVLTNGVYLKSGALTRRYLGTFRSTSTNTTADRLNNRLVWNLYNQVERPVKMDTYTYYGYSGHTYTTSAWRAWNNDSGLIIGYVVGLDRGIAVGFGAGGSGFTSTAAAWDGATPAYDTIDLNARAGRTYSTRGSVLGYHFVRMMQYGQASATYIQGFLEGTFWS